MTGAVIWALGVGAFLLVIQLFKTRVAQAVPIARLAGPGLFEIEVVGESHYQEEIESVVGGRTEDGCEEIVEAALILEEANPHDPKAVRVDIEGKTCGYLSRTNARAYRDELAKLGHGRITGRCKAMVVGGWDRGDDDRGHFGVRLDLPVAV